MAYIDKFGCKYSDDKKEFLRCPENYQGHYTIQEGVTSIGKSAFDNCYGLTSITIPNSVTSIGGGAFKDCRGLTSIVVESGNTTYDSRNGCNAIIETATNTLVVGCQATIIPNSVTSIGWAAFAYCSGLTSVTIPNSVTSIGGRAFYGTAWLANQPDGVIYINQLLYTYKGEMPENTSIVVRDGTTHICDNAFNGCSGLTSITIPNSVTSIGEDAFDECDALQTIFVPLGQKARFAAMGLPASKIVESTE